MKCLQISTKSTSRGSGKNITKYERISGKTKRSNQELMFLNQQYGIAEVKSLGVTTPKIVEPVSAPTSPGPKNKTGTLDFMVKIIS